VTIETLICEDSYVADGTANPRNIGFPIADPTFLTVEVDGIQQTQGAHYTIIGDYAGGLGAIVPISPWADGAAVRYYRVTRLVQDAAIPAGQPLPARRIEAQLDRNVMRTQEIGADVVRAVKVPRGEGEFNLPASTDRAGQFLAFDGAGRPIPASGTGNDPALRTDLAQPDGSSRVFFIGKGLGGRSRALLDRGQQMVYASDYQDFDPTLASDSASAIMRAGDALGVKGGTILIEGDAQVSVKQHLELPPNTGLVGPHNLTGSPDVGGTYPYERVGGSIWLDPTKEIRPFGTAGVRGLFIIREGMEFPSNLDPDWRDSWQGTAIRVQGDDAYVERCMVLGFNQALLLDGFQRPKLSYLQLDCMNGIQISNCLDNAYISFCHFWPFSLVNSDQGRDDDGFRGNAYWFHDTADWLMCTNCFSWGATNGFIINNVGTATLLNCGADNYGNSEGPPFNTDANGIVVAGNSPDFELIGCLTAAHGNSGVYINVSAGLKGQIVGHRAWGGTTHGILVDGGDVQISGSFRDLEYGVSVGNTSSRIFIDNSQFMNIAERPINNAIDNKNVYVGRNNDYGNYTSRAPVTPNLPRPVAVGSPLVVPNEDDIVTVTGTGNFSSVSFGWKGRQLTLVFAGACTLTSAAGQDGLVLASTFNTNANSQITLRHNGFSWIEVSRKA